MGTGGRLEIGGRGGGAIIIGCWGWGVGLYPFFGLSELLSSSIKSE